MNPHTTTSAALSSSVTILFVTVLTILDELIPGVRTWLTTSFTHHWLGKSVLSIGVFLLVWAICRAVPLKRETKHIAIYLNILTITSVLCGLALAVFFIYEAKV